jgi:glycosyltransferase involved in cell wall biosynthesis
MRIAILCETFPKNMGYAVTQLPKALAHLGADVHFVTAGLPSYSAMPDFQETYRDSMFEPQKAVMTERYEGYTIHYLPYKTSFNYVRMEGLSRKLRELRPDIVQTFPTVSWTPLEAALLKPWYGYKLFTGNHTTASVFPLAQRTSSRWEPERLKNTLTRELCGHIVSMFAEKCYAATVDCADVAVRFFGVPEGKIDVIPLGVDTETFFPATTPELIDERAAVRGELGFAPDSIVCIYTGRFSEGKNPLLLAKAVEKLDSTGLPFRSLFFGDGVQFKEIAKCGGATVRKFVPFHQLAKYYRAADIGVWPTQESTSMLDAAACGLPIVVNDSLKAVERIEGNGLQYKLNDLADLVSVLQRLRGPGLRYSLGVRGAQRMRNQFSWHALAQRRLDDYEKVLRTSRGELPESV